MSSSSRRRARTRKTAILHEKHHSQELRKVLFGVNQDPVQNSASTLLASWEQFEFIKDILIAIAYQTGASVDVGATSSLESDPPSTDPSTKREDILSRGVWTPLRSSVESSKFDRTAAIQTFDSWDYHSSCNSFPNPSHGEIVKRSISNTGQSCSKVQKLEPNRNCELDRFFSAIAGHEAFVGTGGNSATHKFTAFSAALVIQHMWRKHIAKKTHRDAFSSNNSLASRGLLQGEDPTTYWHVIDETLLDSNYFVGISQNEYHDSLMHAIFDEPKINLTESQSQRLMKLITQPFNHMNSLIERGKRVQLSMADMRSRGLQRERTLVVQRNRMLDT